MNTPRYFGEETEQVVGLSLCFGFEKEVNEMNNFKFNDGIWEFENTIIAPCLKFIFYLKMENKLIGGQVNG